MNHAPFSIKDALLFGVRALKMNALLLIGVSLLGFSINFSSRMIANIIVYQYDLKKTALSPLTSPLFGRVSVAEETDAPSDASAQISTEQFTTKKGIGLVLLILLWIISTILNLFLLMGWNQIGLDLYDTGRSSFKRLWVPHTKITTFFITACLYSALCTFGLLLLIVPAIIWAIQYSFSDLVVIDSDKKPLGALRTSSTLTYGYKWDLLLLYFIEILITAASIITIIGPFILVYVFFLSRVYVYRKLKEQWQQQHQSPTPFMP